VEALQQGRRVAVDQQQRARLLAQEALGNRV
jgi:hypothetical protein